MSYDDILNFFPEDDSNEENIYQKLKDLGLDLEGLEKEFDNYHPTKELKYEKLDFTVSDPFYNYPSDSGFDLISTEDLEIESLGRALVSTGLKFDIPDGTEIQIRPKSGLALKYGLTVLNTPGTVDSGYNGEIKVIVFNTSSNTCTIKKGMKVAQAVLCPVFSGKFVTLEKVNKIGEKDRGENGFGSTGLNL